MIPLTRLDKQVMYVNPDHIVSIEETPDTVITLFNGYHFIVKEPAADIITKVVAFRARIIRRAGGPTGRKYLDKTKKNLFSRATLNRDSSIANRDEHERVPFHSQEF
ncbi:flagellar FlbD family protein [Oryzomonas sagensis]|uniref:Flagellar FlbD family protein n=1 Tax=Oryzomonas sagensis TaxID=2603857 RepID=A0ABQ6TS89_9BACT|nr:flagellar FlbD family protein [Oryzomonas sagensis]KAB0671873.1 flagellar FlbD family protein [Oryzomonas sagensis]